jgi:serine/threonine protein kinase
VLVWKEMDYKYMKERERQQIVNEVNILSKLSHANIVRYYGK